MLIAANNLDLHVAGARMDGMGTKLKCDHLLHYADAKCICGHGYPLADPPKDSPSIHPKNWLSGAAYMRACPLASGWAT